MERREANTQTNLTKGHIMLMFNKAIIYLLNYYFNALILPVFVTYVKHILHHLLFEILTPFNELAYT